MMGAPGPISYCFSAPLSCWPLASRLFSSARARAPSPLAGQFGSSATPVGGGMLTVSVAAARCPEELLWNGQTLELGEVLGTGAFSTVRAVTVVPGANGGERAGMGIQLVAKVVEAVHAGDEAALLDKLHHPHVVKLMGVVGVGAAWQVLLLERAAGGELLGRVMEHDGLEERCAKLWMKQLLDAVQYLHCNGVVHRDIKPENLLLSSDAPDAALKLADFGSAKRIAEGLGVHTPCGSWGYAAPEQQQRPRSGSDGRSSPYGRPADLWSCGVVAHVLLTGRMPYFHGTHGTSALTPTPEDATVTSSVGSADASCGELRVSSDVCGELSTECVDFLSSLLQPQAHRPSAARALDHAWLGDQSAACALLWTPRRLRALMREQPHALTADWGCSWSHPSDASTTPPQPPVELQLPKPMLTPETRRGATFSNGAMLHPLTCPRVLLPTALGATELRLPFAAPASVCRELEVAPAVGRHEATAHDASSRAEMSQSMSSIDVAMGTTMGAGDASAEGEAPRIKRARSISSALVDLQFF